MQGGHADLGDLGPELRRLAQTILDGLDPAVRMAALRIAGAGPGRCQQVWCPICALAALIAGEEHPLLGIVAEHSVALLTVIRAMVADPGTAPPPPPPPAPGGGPDAGKADGGERIPGHAAYQRIPITIEE